MSYRALSVAAVIALALAAGSVTGEPLKKKPEQSPDLFHPKVVIPTPQAPDDKPFAENYLVFQLSDGDAEAQRLVLNNAANAAREYGPDKAVIEIVTYGPGLRLLFKENENASRIKQLAESGITFSACANTMVGMGRDKESLNSAAKVVSGGVLRINELSQAGWTYIRP